MPSHRTTTLHTSAAPAYVAHRVSAEQACNGRAKVAQKQLNDLRRPFRRTDRRPAGSLVGSWTVGCGRQSETSWRWTKRVQMRNDVCWSLTSKATLQQERQRISGTAVQSQSVALVGQSYRTTVTQTNIDTHVTFSLKFFQPANAICTATACFATTVTLQPAGFCVLTAITGSNAQDVKSQRPTS